MNRPPWGRVAPGVPQGQYAGGPSRASLCHAAIAMPGACAPPMVASQKPGANDIVGGPERQLLEWDRMEARQASIRTLLVSFGLLTAPAAACSDKTPSSDFPDAGNPSSSSSAGSTSSSSAGDAAAPEDAGDGGFFASDGRALCCACGNAACCDPGCPEALGQGVVRPRPLP